VSLLKKLNLWQEAGLINQQTAASIVQFEQLNIENKEKSTPFYLWAIGGVGAFSIIVGIISVVAANWLQISKEVKLGADFLLCTILALAVYNTNAQKANNNDHTKFWLHEVLVLLYYGLILASMALIGQTYQLGGSIAHLLLVWTLVTLPLVLLSRGKFIAILWGIASAITYLMNIIELEQVFNIPESIIITLFTLWPLFFIYLSRTPWLTKHRTTFAHEISRLSWLAIIVFGFFSQLLWYESVNIDTSVYIIIGIFTFISLVLFPKLYSSATKNEILAMRVVLASIYLLTLSANWHNSSFELIGALSNLLYLSILAWAALKIGSITLFNVMTALISLRILIIYFEVFGSMLETGLGLIIMGVLTLSLAWLWLKKSSKLAAKLTTKQAINSTGNTSRDNVS